MKQTMRWLPEIVSGAAAFLLMHGCTTAPTRLETVPHSLTAQAEISGTPGVHYVAGGDMSEQARIGLDSVRREREYESS